MNRLLPDKLREVQGRRDLSVPALARLVGVSDITVRKWRSGEYSPNADNLAKLATALGVGVADITADLCPTCGQSWPK